MSVSDHPGSRSSSTPLIYIGRFAPSPTGPLHFGSLLAALASYFDARHHNGRWLVRMEDLDPPREIEGAADDILRTLEAYGLHWDGSVRYQSERHDHYQALIKQLSEQQLAYRCQCSRQQIAERGPVYDGFCRDRQNCIDRPHAIRVKTDDQPIRFNDRIQGTQQQQLQQHCGDFVIRRKDKLFAYQLAVVCDDAEQQITHIVRGSDLLDSTPRQLYLQQLLGYPQPCYAHIPVMVNEQGQKLSKQTYATALDKGQPHIATFKAMQVLGLQPPASLAQESSTQLLQWGIEHWNIQALPKQLTVPPIEL
ncbi:MAG: tRNA glutamyl-Q(34) synthetase GluQRS [Motiliproteus sp.]|nr:tRNA glutamyl-Q(34) synthetase GluQRS [Motiliproteus sp.]MCW9053708.1 tRNA glutamyl-Q(34) synthetase GluQRS [Motiliproteus sp.]